MILKLLTIMYAWAWSVEPWQPTCDEHWVTIIAASLFLDPIALGAIVATIRWIVSAIIERMEK